MMKKSRLTTFCILACLFLLHACTQSDLTETTPVDKLHALTIQMHVPGQQTATRALEDEEQSAINQVIAICFDAETKKYIQHSYIDGGIVAGDDDNLSFTLTLPKGTYNILLLANSQQIFEAVYGTRGADLDTNVTRDDVAGALTLAQADGTIWPTATTATGWQLPMYGEIESIDINGSTTVNTVDMVRMHATIDVMVGPKCNIDELTEVYVYRYSRRGTLIPAKSTNPTDPAAPTAPTGGYDRVHEEVLKYTVPGTSTDPDTRSTNSGKEFKNSIFLLEAPAGSGDEDALNTNICLVVRAKYKGKTEAKYYRVDIATATDRDPSDENKLIEYEYLPLLRNHRYTVIMQSVRREGYEKLEDALKNRPFTVTAVHKQIADEELVDMVYDNHNYLGISRKNIELDYGGYPFAFTKAQSITGKAETYQEKLKIVTSDTNGFGWTAPSWLSLTDANASNFTKADKIEATGNKTGEYQIMAEPNTTGKLRIGTITLNAGDLKTTIEVYHLPDGRGLSTLQIKEEGETITYDSEFLFAADYDAAHTARELYVTWPNTKGDITISRVVASLYTPNPEAIANFSTSNDAEYLPIGNLSAITGGWGRLKLTLAPAAASSNVNPWYNNGIFSQKSSKITIETNETPKVQKAFYARQVVPYTNVPSTITLPALHKNSLGWNASKLTVTIMTNEGEVKRNGAITFDKPADRTKWHKIGFMKKMELDSTKSVTWNNNYIKQTVQQIIELNDTITRKNAVKYSMHTASVPFKVTKTSTTLTCKVSVEQRKCGTTSSYEYTCLDDKDGKTYPTMTMKDTKRCIMLENRYYDDRGDRLYLNGTNYQMLGNWATDGNTCPAGWRLPTLSELDGIPNEDEKLTRYFYGDSITLGAWSYQNYLMPGNYGWCQHCNDLALEYDTWGQIAVYVHSGSVADATNTTKYFKKTGVGTSTKLGYPCKMQGASWPRYDGFIGNTICMRATWFCYAGNTFVSHLRWEWAYTNPKRSSDGKWSHSYKTDSYYHNQLQCTQTTGDYDTYKSNWSSAAIIGGARCIK